MARTPFVWQDMEHWCGADLLETIQVIDSQEDADSFLLAYAEACDDDDHALHNLRYLAQFVLTDGENKNAEKDATRICELFGIDTPTKNEVISPRQWFAGSSLGVKVAA